MLELGERTLVMGILNITPDSFSDGGTHLDVDRAVAAGLRMVEDGADILDIGGESTRPGAESVGADEELRRVLPVVEKLASLTPALLSIDTYKAVVGREAVARGAAIINDISGLLYDPALGDGGGRDRRRDDPDAHARTIARDVRARRLRRMSSREVRRELEAAMARATAAGVPREQHHPGSGLRLRQASRRTATRCWRGSRNWRRSICRCCRARRASRS